MNTPPPPSRDRASGCLLGLALGDAFGAPHEGGPLERGVWRVIGRTLRGKRRYTDDTQMALDLALTLSENGVQADGGLGPEVQDSLARRFAASYRWSRGYGAGAAQLLRSVRGGLDWRTANTALYPEGSFGNGAAMRAPVIGLLWSHAPALQRGEAAKDQAVITHAHPSGIEGAVLIAHATAAAMREEGAVTILDAALASATLPGYVGRLTTAQTWLEAGTPAAPNNVAASLGNGIAAEESVVTAIYLACANVEQTFQQLLSAVRACGGDVDTIGAMAGAIWGASNGVAGLPESMLATLEDRAWIEEAAAHLAHSRDR